MFQASVALSVVASLTAYPNTQIHIFTDMRNKIYKNTLTQLNTLDNKNIKIYTKTTEIISTVSMLADLVRNHDNDVQIFTFFYGAEELFEDIYEYEADNSIEPASFEKEFDPFTVSAEITNSLEREPHIGFFKNLDIILSRGSRNGVTAYFAFNNTTSANKILRDANINTHGMPPINLFKHKIAFCLNSTELAELIGYKEKFDYADGITATYTDDKEKIRLFKPYIVL